MAKIRMWEEAIKVENDIEIGDWEFLWTALRDLPKNTKVKIDLDDKDNTVRILVEKNVRRV